MSLYLSFHFQEWLFTKDGHASFILKSKNCKSASSGAYSAITNPQISTQECANLQIANPQFLYGQSANRKSANLKSANFSS
jgi:hypothetical protein